MTLALRDRLPEHVDPVGDGLSVPPALFRNLETSTEEIHEPSRPQLLVTGNRYRHRRQLGVFGQSDQHSRLTGADRAFDQGQALTVAHARKKKVGHEAAEALVVIGEAKLRGLQKRIPPNVYCL